MSITPFRFVFAVILLIISLFTVLQVPTVQQDLIAWLIKKAINEPNQQVTVKGVRGIFPFSLHISRIEMQSPDLRDKKLKYGGLIEKQQGTKQPTSNIENIRAEPWLILDNLTIKIQNMLPSIFSGGNFIYLEKLSLNKPPVFEYGLNLHPPMIVAFILGQRYLNYICLESLEIAPNIMGEAFCASLEYFSASVTNSETVRNSEKDDNKLINSRVTRGPVINLKTSMGSISTEIQQPAQNKIYLKNLNINFGDYQARGVIDFAYSNQFKPLETNFSLKFTSAKIKGDVDWLGSIHWQGWQNCQLNGKVDSKRVGLFNNALNREFNYTLKLEFLEQLIKAQILIPTTGNNHKIGGNFIFNHKTKHFKGDVNYDLGIWDGPINKAGIPFKGNLVIDADCNAGLIKLNSIKPLGLLQINWRQNRLNFDCKLPKFLSENYGVSGFISSGEIDTNLSGKVLLQFDEAKFYNLNAKKSDLRVLLKGGKGSYTLNLPLNINGIIINTDAKGYILEDSKKQQEETQQGGKQANEKQPVVTGELNIKTAIPRTKKKTGRLVNKDLQVVNHFKWGLDRLEFDSTYQPFSYSPLKIKGRVGLENGLTNNHSTLDVKFLGQLNLLTLMPWLSNGDRISGNLNSALKITGTIQDPIINGQLEINRGFYEIAEFGTCIGDVELLIKAKGKQLLIKNLSANDGTRRFTTKANSTGSSNSSTVKCGTLSGSGLINIKQLNQPFFDIALKLGDFQIAASDSFFARAAGDITLRGSGSQANIDGIVIINPAGLFIEEINPISKIPILRVISTQKADLQDKNYKKDGFKIFPLNLKLQTPGRFLIRGFGVDSLWAGEVELRGPLNNHAATGGIKLVKGKLELLGKTMKITQGKITYFAESLGQPHLLIIAIKEVNGVQLQLKIEGMGSNLRFVFSSTPALIEEEILSRLLFGKEISKISTSQGLQLATSIASLNGQNGFNLADKLRNVFGLDTLEIKEEISENNKVNSQAVALGKAIGNIYFSIEKNLGSRGGKATASVPITANLNCDVDVGGSQNSGIGLTWVKRY